MRVDSYIFNGYVCNQLASNRGGSHVPFLHARLRQRLRNREPARRAAAGPELAAALRLRALCRAAFRLALHRAARHQRALLALPHPAERQARRAASTTPTIRLWKSAPNVGDHELSLGQLRWNPMPIPTEPTDFLARHAHHDDGRRRLGQVGMAAHVYVANRSMSRRLFLQCRRRTADRAAAGRPRRRHRNGRHRVSSRARSASCRAA